MLRVRVGNTRHPDELPGGSGSYVPDMSFYKEIPAKAGITKKSYENLRNLLFPDAIK